MGPTLCSNAANIFYADEGYAVKKHFQNNPLGIIN